MEEEMRDEKRKEEDEKIAEQGNDEKVVEVYSTALWYILRKVEKAHHIQYTKISK